MDVTADGGDVWATAREDRPVAAQRDNGKPTLHRDPGGNEKAGYNAESCTGGDETARLISAESRRLARLAGCQTATLARHHVMTLQIRTCPPTGSLTCASGWSSVRCDLGCPLRLGLCAAIAMLSHRNPD
jgi:hypothetical protein